MSSNPRADNFFLDALVCPEGAADVLAEEVASLFISLSWSFKHVASSNFPCLGTPEKPFPFLVFRYTLPFLVPVILAAH